jgi:hypothetical protein
MRGAWDRLWFAPARPAALGAFRALLFAGLVVLYARADFAGYAAVPAALRGTHAAVPVPVLPEAPLRVAHALWLGAMTLACVGLWTRWATGLSFALGAYLLGVAGSHGRVDHTDLPVVLALLVMAASRAGDALSLDALRKGGAPPADAEYGWPLRAIRLTLAAAFLAAGVSKLRHAGLAWITTDNLRLWLIERSCLPFPAQGLRNLEVARLPGLCRALAAATVAIELLYPLALVSRRARLVLVPASLLMLAGFALLLGPRFTTFALLSLAWLDWDALTRPRGAAPAPAP